MKNALIILASLVIPLLLIEFGLNLTNYKALKSKSSHLQNYFVKDEIIGYDIGVNNKKQTHTILDVSYDTWSNNLGCFDKEYNGEPYIYLAGDSYSWGYSKFEESWGYKLEEFTGIITLKCGVPAFGTKQELIKTTRLLEKLPTPKLIIVQYTRDNDYINDYNFPDTTVRNGYLVPNNLSEETYKSFDKYCTAEKLTSPHLQRIKCLLKDHSIIYNLLKGTAHKLAQSTLSKEFLNETGLLITNTSTITEIPYTKEHLENVKGFKTLAQKYKTKLLFVLVPSKNNKDIIKFLEKENIDYIDLKLSENTTWKHDHHWNKKGNEEVARAVENYLLNN